MKNVIQVTKEIPTNAQILLVDVEAAYLEGTDYEWSPEIMETVDTRIEQMAETAKVLKEKGHSVYIIADMENDACIFEPFRELPILPPWGYLNLPVQEDEIDPAKIYHLEPTIAATLKKDEVVLVAGLWREQCVLSVARILSYHGYKAVLSLNDDLCLQAEIAFSEEVGISLEQNCAKANLLIKPYEYEG